jgi:hypothetical protein
MLAAVVAILVIGFINAPAAQAPRTSQLPSPTKPLDKPEPLSLLSKPELDLTQIQRQSIEKINREWQGERGRLEAAMSRFQPQQGRVDQISSGLQDYSQLSREYDATRSKSWSAALAVLTPSQQKEVQR